MENSSSSRSQRIKRALRAMWFFCVLSLSLMLYALAFFAEVLEMMLRGWSDNLEAHVKQMQFGRRSS
jgi:hypothetical protein